MNLLPSLMLWAQATVPGVPNWLFNVEEWLFVFGDPAFSTPGVWGGVITWLKVVGLFALLSWVFSWVAAAVRTRRRPGPITSTSPRWSRCWAAWARSS